MGYTHYYEQKRSFTDAEWSIIVKGWRLISKEAKHYLDDKSNLDELLSISWLIHTSTSTA